MTRRCETNGILPTSRSGLPTTSLHGLLLLPILACGSEATDPLVIDAAVEPDAAVEDAGIEVDAAVPPPEVRIDGLFDDWIGTELLASDPAGDATGAFDVTALRVRSAGAVLYLRFDVGARLNLNAGDESEGTLRLEIGLPGGRQLSIDHRALDPRLDGRALIWEEIDYEAAPTHSSTEFEVAMDLGLLGVEPGETVAIDLAGSDSLSEPVMHELAAAARPLERRSPDRQGATTLRLASLNVLESGLLPGDRHDPIVRLLRAADADVYLLGEEYDLTHDELVTVFREIRDEPWSVHKVRDNVIASRFALTPVPGHHERYAAALLEVPGAGSILVIGVHLSCCGWDGNVDDEYRIDEANGIVRTIEDVRATGVTAPAVVMGDWNLVGSREPLDVVLEPDRLDLEQWLLPHLVGAHVTTWRSSASFFPPGILDLVVHDRSLVRRNGFVLEERRLSDEERVSLGLEAEDGLATDHLPIVADFEL